MLGRGKRKTGKGWNATKKKEKKKKTCFKSSLPGKAVFYDQQLS